MNTFLKGMLGAAALAGATFSTASAQDYTWTLTLDWYGNSTHDGSNYVSTGEEPPNAGASGNFVFEKVSPGVYNLKSWDIQTTSGNTLLGTNSTGFAVSYVSGGDGTGTATLNGVEFLDDFGNFRLYLPWFTSEVVNMMNDADVGNFVELIGTEAVEQELPEVNGLRRRTNGDCGWFEASINECFSPRAGWVTLASITPNGQSEEPNPTATPEPASMALFGAGLLGLFAARRRRAA